MTRFRLYATTLATSCNLWKSYRFPRMKEGSAIEARLQTAVSSGAEYSMISVQRLDDLIVPKFFWFDFSASRILIWSTDFDVKRTVGVVLVAHKRSTCLNLRFQNCI